MLPEIVSLKEIKPLRHLVLWQHLPTKDDCVIDPDSLDSTFQFGIKNEEGQVVCCGTFLEENNPNFDSKNQYRLRAMGTHPEYKGKGLGTKLIAAAKEFLFTKGIDMIWCDARTEASVFYLKIGFAKVGEEYMVPEIGPHYLMYIEL